MSNKQIVNDILAEINTTLGKDVVKFGDDSTFELVRVPTGSLTVDRITGGGLALGRHVEFYGSASAGKSLVAYKTAAAIQKAGGTAALIDAESSYTPSWFKHIGGIPEELIISQPEIAEDAVEAMIIMMNKKVDIIIVDSVSALLTKEERAKAPTEEARIASQARFMSINLRRLTTMNDKTLVIWVNQQRTNIGVSFGNPNVVSGGKSLGFYDTTRVEFVKGEQIKKAATKVSKFKVVASTVSKGHWVYVKSMKDKSTKPHMEGAYIFNYDELKIDEISEIIQLGLEDGIITRTGNKFAYTTDAGEKFESVERTFRKLISNNDVIRAELMKKIQLQTEVLAAPMQAEDGEEE